MRLLRRHWGSQTEDSAPTSGGGSLVTKDGNVDWYPGNVWSDAPPPLPSRQGPISRWLTARQVLTASLTQDADLAHRPGRVDALVNGILLDLADHGLEIVQRCDVE